MLRINREAKCFERLQTPDLKGADLSERYHIQAMVCANPQAFFSELGEELLLLGQEVYPAQDIVDDRIDLLALDREGSIVVIELKRGSNKLQLLQALSYAAMMEKWDSDSLLGARAKLTKSTTETVEDEFRQFLNNDIEGVNQNQRVVLVAEDFDYEVLITAEWLSEKYGVEIGCYRLTLSTDGKSEYLACIRVFPPTQADEQAIRRKRKATGQCKWATWEAALAGMSNSALVDFFKDQLGARVDNYLPRRALKYSLGDRRRFSVYGRQDQAYVWQNGRFAGDATFWTERLGSHADIKPVKDERCLRFSLSTEDQFSRFVKAISSEISARQFQNDGVVQDTE